MGRCFAGRCDLCGDSGNFSVLGAAFGLELPKGNVVFATFGDATFRLGDADVLDVSCGCCDFNGITGTSLFLFFADSTSPFLGFTLLTGVLTSGILISPIFAFFFTRP
jgi:hypothetical protein